MKSAEPRTCTVFIHPCVHFSFSKYFFIIRHVTARCSAPGGTEMTRFMREEQVGHLATGLKLGLLALFPNEVLFWL